ERTPSATEVRRSPASCRASVDASAVASAPAEGLPPLEVALRIDQMPIALDVPVLAADDEEHEVLVRRDVGELSRRRRLDVHHPAGTELACLALHLDSRGAAVDEVQLVLLVVVVGEALEAGRVDDDVDAERSHPERVPHLAEARALAQLVDRREAVSHGAS